MRPSGVDFYFERFLTEHLARHPRAGLPKQGTKEADVVFKAWRKFLGEVEGLSYEALTTASERLITEPAPDKKHFSTLLAFAKEAILARKPEGKRNDLTSREGAEIASKSCDRCGGTGLVTVWRRLPVPERCPETTAAHCVCALGRWMHRYWEAKDSATARRFVDFDRVLNGRSAWLAEQPSKEHSRHDAF